MGVLKNSTDGPKWSGKYLTRPSSTTTPLEIASQLLLSVKQPGPQNEPNDGNCFNLSNLSARRISSFPGSSKRPHERLANPTCHPRHVRETGLGVTVLLLGALADPGSVPLDGVAVSDRRRRG